MLWPPFRFLWTNEVPKQGRAIGIDVRRAGTKATRVEDLEQGKIYKIYMYSCVALIRGRQ